MFYFLFFFIIVLISVAWSDLAVQKSHAVETLFELIHHNRPLNELETLLRDHKQFNVNIRHSGQLWTPLIMAANFGHLEIAKLLLHYQADPSIEEADGFTALIFASHHGHSQMVELLLDKGANIYHKTQRGDDAISLASTTEVKHILQNKRNDMERNFKAGGEFLELCSTADESLDGVKQMVHKRGRYIINGEVNRKGWNSLHIATVSKNVELMKFLLQNGGNPSTAERDHWTPLLFATSSKCSVCVQLLVDFGALIGEGHSTTFEIGASNNAITGFLRIVELAENHGEIISTVAGAGLRQHLNRKRITTDKIFDLDAGAIMNFVNSGANPNTPNDQGVTSLMLLCQTGELEAARDLLADGADVNWQEADGWTAAMFSVHGNHLEIIKQLLTVEDIDLSITNRHGETAADIARALQRTEILKLLDATATNIKTTQHVSNGNSAENNGIFSFFGF